MGEKERGVNEGVQEREDLKDWSDKVKEREEKGESMTRQTVVVEAQGG